MPWFVYGAQSLNKSQEGIWTSFYYEDRGDGTVDWVGRVRSYDGAMVTIGAKADTAVTATDTTPGSVVGLLKGVGSRLATALTTLASILTAIGANTDASAPTGNGYTIALLKAVRDNTRWGRPGDSTQVNVSSGNVANAAAVAAMPATASVINYVTGIEITFAGATAAANFVATLAGLVTGTISFICVAPAGATIQGTPILLNFDPPIPSSAVNTAITLTLPALGAGNTHACVNIHGYRV